MSGLKVMVSSTCFRLEQIRKDLEAFIEEMGYEPLLSDSRKLAPPPGLSKTDTCKWLVANADIFVLIIGDRYGSTDRETGKSITNVEYDEAFRRGMPIYTFVMQRVWDARPTYESLKRMVNSGSLDKEGLSQALQGVVEDARVFDFVSRVDGAKRDSWMHQFTEAKDITDRLKKCWSTLFQDMLSRAYAPNGGRNLGAIVNRPRLSVKWFDPRRVKDGVLVFPPLPELSQDDVFRRLNSLRPTDDEIGSLESNRGRVRAMLDQVKLYQGRVGITEDGGESKIEAVYQFRTMIDRMLALAQRDFVTFRGRYEADRDICRFAVEMLNDGDAPADNPRVTISGSRNTVLFLHPQHVRELSLQIPKERPKGVVEALQFATSPNAIILPASEELLPYLRNSNVFQNPKVREYDPTLLLPKTPPRREVEVVGGRIEIAIRGKMMHNFREQIAAENIVCLFLNAPGKEVEVAYECHAENLPTPAKGILRAVRRS